MPSLNRNPGLPGDYRCQVISHVVPQAAGVSLWVNVQLICSWLICSHHFTKQEVADQAKFFRALGRRVRDLRIRHGFSQEDMISFGFSARHWQQIEVGRPITVTTLLRICEVFQTPLAGLVRGMDKDIYEPPDPELIIRIRSRKRKKSA